MKYPFATRYNGTFYPANTEIPVEGKQEELKLEKPKTEKKKEVEIPKVLQQETEIERLAKEEKKKIDIPKFKNDNQVNKLSTAEVKDLARRLKIEGYEEMSGNALKRLILKMSKENYAEE